MINFGWSFHIFCKKEKFTELSVCEGNLITLSNNERVKVEGIGEIVVVTRDGVRQYLVR